MLRTSLIVFMLFISATVMAAIQNFHWKPVNSKFDSIVAEMEQMKPNDSRINMLLDSLDYIANQTGLPILKCRYLFWKANFETKDPTSNSNYKSELLKEALTLLDTLEYRYDYIRIRYSMINPVQSNENYIEQYKSYLKLLLEFENFNDAKHQADINRWLGILMSELGDNDIALEYLLKANNLYEKTNQKERIVTNMISIAIVYNSIGKKEEAIDILEKTLKRKDITLDTSVMIAIYTSLNNTLIDIEKKNNYAKEAYRLASLYENDYMKNITRLNLGVSYLINNSIDSANFCFKKTYDYAIENKNHRLLLPSLFNLSLVYEKKRDWPNAYTFIARYLHVKDSIQGSDKISEINKIEAGIAIKEYQNQLIIADQKNELQRKQVLITILVAIGLILGALLVLIYILQKKRITESQLQNEELHNKNLQQEIDFQNRELSSITLILSEKNGILNSLLTQMERFRNNKEMSNSCELALRKLITDNLRSENEWESFKLHFEKVHPDFFFKLKNLCHNLSENELRLCAYIRIGMTSKQISQMISVLPATINTNRYLLRKKFELSQEASLDDYIREL
ncbi:MAG: tetratricopeptide repeat protein [Bacteroidales bacterium]